MEWIMNEAKVLELAVAAARSIARDEFVDVDFAERIAVVFDADAGVGLATVRSVDGAPGVRVAVAGASPYDGSMAARAAPFVATHPGFRAMRRVGTTRAVRLSDEVALRDFWGTDSWFALHGHSDGRFPMAASFHVGRESYTFLGLHRRRRDFSDLELTVLSRMQQPIAHAFRYRAAVEGALARILSLRGHDGSPTTPPPTPAHRSIAEAPTRREEEVLVLMAAGWTNLQIATRLRISERTVRKHLSSVYEKAGVPGRAAAAVWWTSRQAEMLVDPPPAPADGPVGR